MYQLSLCLNFLRELCRGKSLAFKKNVNCYPSHDQDRFFFFLLYCFSLAFFYYFKFSFDLNQFYASSKMTSFMVAEPF